jgi:hypothetical protein
MRPPMRFKLISLFLFSISISCFAQPDRINLSGVWLLHGKGVLTHKSQFSWGDNPVNIEYTAIDLGADPPMIFTQYGGFFIEKVITDKSFYVLLGKWVDGTPGEIRIGVVDKNTIWFESMSSHSTGPGIGRSELYSRVPVDAPITPIDPTLGPRSP